MSSSVPPTRATTQCSHIVQGPLLPQTTSRTTGSVCVCCVPSPSVDSCWLAKKISPGLTQRWPRVFRWWEHNRCSGLSLHNPRHWPSRKGGGADLGQYKGDGRLTEQPEGIGSRSLGLHESPLPERETGNTSRTQPTAQPAPGIAGPVPWSSGAFTLR